MAAVEIRDILDNETGKTIFPRTHVNAIIGLNDWNFFEEYIDENNVKSIRLRSGYAGLWTTGFMSAGGLNAASSGGVSYLKELLDVYHNSNGILRPDGTAVQNGDTLIYNSANSRWNAAPQSPFNGGEITQDLWLHTGSSNYGSKLWFGNKGSGSGNVYLHEDSDNHLTIHANKGITLTVNPGYNVSIPSLTLGSLSGVSISSPSDGQALVYRNGVWGNETIQPGGAVDSITVGTTNYTPVSGVVTIPAYPTTLPASDVYDWAKAATKPSYNFSEIGSKPTTLSGYGISDAKIESGTITLGSNTITPLTSHQTVTLATGTNSGTVKLTVGGTVTDNIAVKNCLTTDGGQTITGSKTFSSANILTATDDTNALGADSKRFHDAFVRNVYLSYLGFRDGSSPTTARGNISMGNGYAQITIVGSPNNTNYMFYSGEGFFKSGGGVPCGKSDHRWSDIYSVNANITGGFTFRNTADTANTCFMSGQGGYFLLRTGANISTAHKDIVFHESYGFYPDQAGVNLGYNGANYRWENIYGVNADLTGDFSLAPTSHIDLGPIRIEYDATHNALHITKKSSSDTTTYGFYVDGFVSAGGPISNA